MTLCQHTGAEGIGNLNLLRNRTRSMATTITIRDESTGGKTLQEWALEVFR